MLHTIAESSTYLSRGELIGEAVQKGLQFLERLPAMDKDFVLRGERNMTGEATGRGRM